MRDLEKKTICPECEVDTGRRRFLASAGAAAAVAATGGLAAIPRALAALEPLPKGTKVAPAEQTVLRLYQSLTADQKAATCLPFADRKVQQVGANWHVVPKTIGDLFGPEQQRRVHEVLRGVTSEEGYARMIRQMQDDDGGFERYSCASFGEPGNGPSEWVMTGRHLTIRADGNHFANAVFGGPIVYGHGLEGNYKANLFYYQTKMANEVFRALDGKQREKALLPEAPAENAIQLKKGGFAGIAVEELTRDQRGLVDKVMHALLAPYREADVKEAMEGLKANGGLEKVHLAFYKNEDLGNDQEWDIWRLEGPTLVWHFRGAPHVHTWVNFKTKPAT